MIPLVRIPARIQLWTFCAVIIAAVLYGLPSTADAQGLGKGKKEDLEMEEQPEPAPTAPGPLESIPVPLPSDLDDYVQDREAAIVLGKALFWDMQVGSDGKVACATCHYHAGVDQRTVHTLAPGAGELRANNYRLSSSDFPFHRLQDPYQARSEDNPVIFDTAEIVGSAGVVKKDFIAIRETNDPVDEGRLVPDDTFQINGANARKVTGRNAPSTINSVFNDRNFWDGRANHFFNGVNAFGDMDSAARVWKTNRNGNRVSQVRILLRNASLASQAVGPALSAVEMSWKNRLFPNLGQKMLLRTPLALQKVHPDDSVLGAYANDYGNGLKDLSYAELVQLAFRKEWWGSKKPIKVSKEVEYTHMEANFSLFWGISIMLYEATLVSDQTPFDEFAKGKKNALTARQRKGLDIFLNEGKCINCHSGPEFTGATVSELRGTQTVDEGLIELMLMQIGPEAFYDGGFYNIGVRPTQEDLGVGASHPQFGPLSLTRRVQEGQDVDLNGQEVSINPGDRVAVDGAFKTPGLRNIELTGPYMHNGGMRTLNEVVYFYARRADFFKENIDDLDPDVDGIPEIIDDEKAIEALVDFMKSLTDERVRYQRAPFDHPELRIPEGDSGSSGGETLDVMQVIPAVGRNGSTEPLLPFEEVLP